MTTTTLTPQTRTQTRRQPAPDRQHGQLSRGRRAAAWPPLAGMARGRVERLGLSSFARLSVAAGALLALAIGYLLVGAQATQSTYELTRLRQQNAQLQAEQEQLRYQAASAHTPAHVEQAAHAAGLQQAQRTTSVGAQPVALDLEAPIGPGRTDESPLWQRTLASVFGGVARTAFAADR